MSFLLLSIKIIISFCQNYSADIGELTKTNPEIAVNEWINKQTRGKIPKIVGEKNCLVADNLRNNDNIMCSLSAVQPIRMSIILINTEDHY